MKIVTLSYQDIESYTLEICRQIQNSGWQPQRVVGISRGGLLPAVLLSQWFDIPMVPLNVSLRDSGECESNTWLAEDAQTGMKTLVVDDINDTGATFSWIKEDWQTSVYLPIDWSFVKFASVVENLASGISSSYSGKEINKVTEPQWIRFPWENFWKTT
tara:strand:+ start:8166 stop:8642 length:477 start_codon:yes stop_codon:yes gene_type:complete